MEKCDNIIIHSHVHELRPQDSGGGDVRISTSRDETNALPVDTYGRGMAAGLIVQNMFVFPGHGGRLNGRYLDRPAAGRHNSLMGSIREQLKYPKCWSMWPRGVYFSGEVAVGVASPAFFASGVTIGVTSLAVAGWRPWPTLLGVSLLEWHLWPMLGMASLADLPGNLAGRVTGLTKPVGVVTNEMTFLEECGV